MAIERQTTHLDVTMPTAGLSDAVHMGPFSGGIVHMSAAWTNTASLAFHVSDEEEGTYQLMYQADGTVLRIESDDTVAVQGFSYPLPAELFGCQFVKLFSNNPASTAAITQGAARVLRLDLKA